MEGIIGNKRNQIPYLKKVSKILNGKVPILQEFCWLMGSELQIPKRRKFLQDGQFSTLKFHTLGIRTRFLSPLTVSPIKYPTQYLLTCPVKWGVVLTHWPVLYSMLSLRLILQWRTSENDPLDISMGSKYHYSFPPSPFPITKTKPRTLDTDYALVPFQEKNAANGFKYLPDGFHPGCYQGEAQIPRWHQKK